MKRVLLLILILTATAQASTKRFIGSTSGTATASKYYVLDSLGVAITSEANAQTLCPGAITLNNMKIWASAAPNGAGKSWTVLVRKNAGDTAMTATITNAETSATYTGDVAIAADDNLAVYVTSANSPDAAILYWEIKYTPTTTNQQMFMGRGTALATSGTQYFVPKYSMSTAAASSALVFSTAGTVSNLHLELSAAPGVDASRIFTARLNTIAQTLVATAGAADTAASDDAHPIAVVAGDYVDITSTVTGTPAACNINWGFIFTPTTADKWMLSTCGATAMGVLSRVYYGISQYDMADTTETDVSQYVTALKITNCYLQLSGAPGSDKSYTLNLRDDAQNSSPQLQVIIANTATAGNASATVNVADNSLLATDIFPSGPPTDRYLSGVSYTVDESTSTQFGAIASRRQRQ